MVQENETYLLLLAIIFAAGIYTEKLIEIRIKREELIHKYKVGTAEYENIQRALGARRLALGIVATVIPFLALVFEVYRYRHIHDLIILTVFVALVTILGFIITPWILRAYSAQGKK